MSMTRNEHTDQTDLMDLEANEPALHQAFYLARAAEQIKLNNLDDAETDIYKAIEIDIEDSARAYELLAMIAEARNDYNFAIKLAETALKKAPETTTDAQITLTTIAMTDMIIGNLTPATPTLFNRQSENKRRLNYSDDAVDPSQQYAAISTDEDEPCPKKPRFSR